MDNFTRFGKLNFGLGIVFLILGAFTFIQNFDGIFIIEDQYSSLSFICLGIALFFVSIQMVKEKGS